MKNIVLFTIITVLFLSCQNGKTKVSTSKIVNKTNSVDKSKFHYKNLTVDIKNTIDTIQPKNIKELFGVWSIDSIANVGGTMQDEKIIQSQIGHELLISESQLSLRFLNDSFKIDNPNYSLVKNTETKGTTLWYGYKNSREFITSLKVDESRYFEIINNHELAYFYDGRIYLFKRKSIIFKE
ncbi:hypothetical protein [Flavobacterium sp. 2]|uniref:hypothetical protein n=1 Tax=Flavobacterium sp. 2 TaxID=308053 RepID=UPI000C18D8D3|nr:hypothetical protein [Flavobacterium sp. 2]PIF71662.1 hypothetical protein CLU99_2438 [Flavobacterium sp. 2]